MNSNVCQTLPVQTQGGTEQAGAPLHSHGIFAEEQQIKAAAKEVVIDGWEVVDLGFSCQLFDFPPNFFSDQNLESIKLWGTRWPADLHIPEVW